MTDWRADGTYVEACTCEAACPCLFESAPSHGDCLALIGWRIARGHHGDVRLDGLNVAMAVYSDKKMIEGDWKVALYVDERADDRQREALQAIFSGQAGGHLGSIAPLVGEVLGVGPARIAIEAGARRFRVEVGGVGAYEGEGIAGQDGGPVQISGHPFAPVPGVPFTAARSERFRYADHGLSTDVGGRNALFADFTYRP